MKQSSVLLITIGIKDQEGVEDFFSTILANGADWGGGTQHSELLNTVPGKPLHAPLVFFPLAACYHLIFTEESAKVEFFQK